MVMYRLVVLDLETPPPPPCGMHVEYSAVKGALLARSDVLVRVNSYSSMRNGAKAQRNIRSSS